jgi:hypothetical protein
MMTDFTNLPSDKIHHFVKNIKNINDGHCAQIIQIKCAHTWYIPIDLHSYSGTGTGTSMHKHTPNNETFGLGTRKTIDTIMKMDTAHAYPAIPNAWRNVA